jgi:hypothetical protein
MSVLEFQESPVSVRVGETFVWDFDITPWAASGANPVVSAINQRTGEVITSTIFPAGSPSLVGTTYTLPEATGWVKNVPVVITAQFESGGNTLRPYFIVQVSA